MRPDDPENANRPGVLSQGTYGAKVAVPLILELLARHGLRQTFFIPGRVAERHPHRVQEILARELGWSPPDEARSRDGYLREVEGSRVAIEDLLRAQRGT